MVQAASKRIVTEDKQTTAISAVQTAAATDASTKATAAQTAAITAAATDATSKASAAQTAAIAAAAADATTKASAAAFNPDDAGYDLWILAGQSNMSGRGLPVDTARLDVTNPRVWQFGNSGTYQDVISLATSPLAMHDSPSGLSPGYSFGAEIAKMTPVNRSILLVPVARGNTGFTLVGARTWDQTAGAVGYDNDLAGNMINQTKKALAAAGPNARVAGVLWHQGEADANDLTYANTTYANKMDALIAWTRTQLGLPNLPWVIGQMVPEGIALSAIRQVVDAIHYDTPRRSLNTAYAYGISGAYNTGDTTHYAATGVRALARNYALASRLARVNVLGTAPAVPTDITITQTGGGALTVAVQRGLGRYTNFTLRYRLVGNTTWTTAARASSLSVLFYLSGLAGGSYEFQAASMNEQGTSAWSSTVTATVQAVASAATSLVASVPNSSGAGLTWVGGANATSYRIESSTDSGTTWVVQGTTGSSPYTVTTLAASTTYQVRVVAYNAISEAVPSNTVTFTTAASGTLIDTVGVTPLAAYGLRQLRTGYTGKAVKVRRASDSALLDIGFTGGGLDTGTLIDFTGTASAYVNTLYDQSGNGRDLTQGTAAAQFRIVNNGVVEGTSGIQAMVMDGLATYMTRAAIGLYAQSGGWTACFVVQTTVTAGKAEGRFISEGRSTSSAPTYGFGWLQATIPTLAGLIRNDANVNGGTSFNGTVGAANAWGMSAIEDSTTRLRTYVNGVMSNDTAATRPASPLTVDQFSIGALDRNGARSSYQQGLLAELLIFPALTDSQRQVVEANQRSRFGF